MFNSFIIYTYMCVCVCWFCLFVLMRLYPTCAEEESLHHDQLPMVEGAWTADGPSTSLEAFGTAGKQIHQDRPQI